MIKSPQTKELKFPVVRDLNWLEKTVERMKKEKVLYSLDLETSSLNPWRGEIVGASICTSSKGAFYVPFRHRHDQPFDGKEAMRVLRGLFEDYPFIAFNAVFELSFLEESEGVEHRCWVEDPALMAYAKGGYRAMSLKAVAGAEEIPFEVDTYKEFMIREGLHPKKGYIGALPTTKVADYCGRDALACYLLYKKLKPQVENSGVYKIEKRLLPVVFKLRKNGVRVAEGYFKEEQERLDSELSLLHTEIEAAVSEEAGEETHFNVGSTQQLGEILFDVLGLPCDKYTKTGRPSVDKKTLNRLKWEYPIVKDIIAYKEIRKRATTYYNKYLSFVEEGGRIHASYNQYGVPTGRFSCSDPNLQNIPRKEVWVVSKDRRKIEVNTRAGFIAESGWVLMEFDYSQIEARVAAGVSGEPALVNTFQKGEDYHTRTASLVFDIPMKDVTKKQRYLGKKLNFALSYGMGANALFHELREEMDITFKQAQMFRRKYIQAYKLMFDEAAKIAKAGRPRGCVETMFGRKVMVWDWDEREDADRMAYNAVIQGTAADILKIKMYGADKLIEDEYREEAKIVMTTHDSLTFEVSEEVNLQEFVDKMKKTLQAEITTEGGFRADIKIPVNVSIGYSWGNLLELEDFGGKVSNLLRQLKGEEQEEKGESGGKVFVLDFDVIDYVGMSRDELGELKSLIKNNPGENTIIIKVGEKENLIPVKTSLDLGDKDRIMLLTGGRFYEKF